MMFLNDGMLTRDRHYDFSWKVSSWNVSSWNGDSWKVFGGKIVFRELELTLSGTLFKNKFLNYFTN